MADQQTPGSQQLDDGLAEFTDHLMDVGASEMPVGTEQDQELSELQRTVVRLVRAFGSNPPDEDMARRIRANLLEEWRKAHEPQQSEDTLWERLRSGFHIQWLTPRQVYALAVLVMVVVAGVILSSGSSGGDDLPGAAVGQTSPGLLPIILVAGICLGGIVWWLIRQRRP